VLAGEGKSAAKMIARLDPIEREAAMEVFTHVPTPTALNHDSRSKEEKSKADAETNKERIDLYVKAHGTQPASIAEAKKWIRGLKPTKNEGKVTGLNLARLRYARVSEDKITVGE
jgi:hypothetical protein